MQRGIGIAGVIISAAGLLLASRPAQAQHFGATTTPWIEGYDVIGPATVDQHLGRPSGYAAEVERVDYQRLPPVDAPRSGRGDVGGYISLGGDEEPSIDQRVEVLEENWRKQQDGAAKKAADDAKKPSLKVSGRIHLDYWGYPDSSLGANAFETGDSTEDPLDRFLFRRLRFGVAGDLPSNMQYKIEIDFAGGSEVKFKDAYLGWHDLPFLQTLRLGNQKRPYGLDHLNSSRYNVFMERPFVIEAFNQDARRLGICSYGVSENEAWNWRYGAFMMEDISEVGQTLSDHYQVEFAGRLANTIWYDECSDGRGYAHWALSGTIADPDGFSADNQGEFQTRPEARTSSKWLSTDQIDGANTYELLGTEGVVNFGPLQVVGEYQIVWLQRSTGFGPDLEFHGGYVYLSYFLTGEHMPWDREEGILGRPKPFEDFFLVRMHDGCIGRGWGAWQVAARYSHGDLTDDDIFGGVGDSFTFGLNWYWTAHAKMQFNYIYGQIDDHAAVDGQTAGSYNIFGARFMVDF